MPALSASPFRPAWACPARPVRRRCLDEVDKRAQRHRHKPPSWRLGIAPMRVSHVINGARPVTAELALLFGKAFDQSPEYWLNLQSAYDPMLARQEIGARLKSVKAVAY